MIITIPVQHVIPMVLFVLLVCKAMFLTIKQIHAFLVKLDVMFALITDRHVKLANKDMFFKLDHVYLLLTLTVSSQMQMVVLFVTMVTN